MATKLRAVAEGEARPRQRPKSVTTAANEGSRYELLIALRARIAKAVQDSETPARDLAALARRLLDIAKEIELIELAEEGDDVDHAAATPDERWDSEAI